MNKTKKILSIILAVMMILTAVPLAGMTAFAATSYDYLAPVYVDDDPTKGIASWETKSTIATPVTNSTTTLSTGWYIVTGEDVQTSDLTVTGNVNLIRECLKMPESPSAVRAIH